MHPPVTTQIRRKGDVRQRARDERFDACGVAAATPIDPEDRLGEWLRNGYHADMDWMERTCDIRQDVQKKLPGAKSVVVVARNYYAPRPEAAEGAGKVASYAWGRDYHRVLLKPLRRLARFIESLEDGAKTYCCIDSGPMLERGWAARAGLGWIGKNSLVLRRDLGSWFFLGTILTTVELEPDSPVPDQCGSCRACLDACPTEAIVEPAVVDSRRCISYQTIENRGDIPEELRTKFGNWVFGCDICQEVCPWNRKVAETDELDFHPRPGHANLDPKWIEEMDDETFRREFSGTPILRTKHKGMLRNVSLPRKNSP
jgi:epoxyqueuosine reductase